jgi:PDZ domain-containing protein
VNDTPVLTADQLTHTLSGFHSGQTITLDVEKGGAAPAGPVSVTLHDTVIKPGSGFKPFTLDLGIQTEDQVDYTLPVKVSIDVAGIGGPSAGLAMTLGVIDALHGGSLTGGRTVAATGTIDAQGDVGDVGGVAQKTVAVENAGATIFLVPPQEYKAALSKDRPGLKVYEVSTLDQALAILAAHGGSVPPKPTTPPASAVATSAG